jgi:MoxR-like ATPase
MATYIAQFKPATEAVRPPTPKEIPVDLFTTPTQPPEPVDMSLSPRIKTIVGGIAQSRTTENLRVTGPSGCGKTSLGQWIAQETNRPLLIMDCAVVREPRDWFGFRTVKDGAVLWQDTEFVRAIEAGNYVVVLDELNRASSSVLNGLFPLLDHRRRAWIEERQRAVTVGANTMFIATTNTGSRYVGAGPLDAALDERFTRVIEMSYLNRQDELALLTRRVPTLDTKWAEALCEIAAKTRQSSSNVRALSTRRVLAAAHDLARYGQESLEYTILNSSADPVERSALAALLIGKFPNILEGCSVQVSNSTLPF